MLWIFFFPPLLELHDVEMRSTEPRKGSPSNWAKQRRQMLAYFGNGGYFGNDTLKMHFSFSCSADNQRSEVAASKWGFVPSVANPRRVHRGAGRNQWVLMCKSCRWELWAVKDNSLIIWGETIWERRVVKKAREWRGEKKCSRSHLSNWQHLIVINSLSLSSWCKIEITTSWSAVVQTHRRTESIFNVK